MSHSLSHFDVIVIGAGHAGCEAALAAARAGCSTLVLTPNLDRVGFMPCNPSIGGPGKSHLVAEVDALGGEMARAADLAALQVRCLNTSKGPAVQAIRIQEDKALYAMSMKQALESQANLRICQDDAVMLAVECDVDGRQVVRGVRTRLLGQLTSTAVIVTAGTFLRAALIAGEERVSGSRAGDRADAELAGSISASGFRLRRLKTGTPPRIDARTVDFSLCEEQPGSDDPLWLSRDGARGRIEPLSMPALPMHRERFADGWRRQLSCWRISTNEATHDIIRANLHRAPMFNGSIEGVGPRYCPSVEDKVARFGEKPSHPVFLEPEGWQTNELYVQGMSTSLPRDVQDAALRTIPALREAVVTRYGYAVEYDAVDPVELTSTLETSRIGNLFFAGQINGTSGYEEAAGQGILAGVNAAASVQQRPPVVLARHEAYIGVMVDDLVNKPFDEPYRMLTARAEFRLSLRPSTADRRLGALAFERGLISQARYDEIRRENEQIRRAVQALEKRTITPSPAISYHFSAAGIEQPSHVMAVADLLRRPQVSIGQVGELLAALFEDEFDGLAWPLERLIEEDIKYGAFVERESREVKRRSALEQRPLPDDINYSVVKGLRIEARGKLNQRRPRTIGEASKLSGVTPADIAALLIFTGRAEAATL